MHFIIKVQVLWFRRGKLMVIWLHCHCKNRLLPFDTGIPLNKTKKKTLKKIMTWESISQKFCFSFHGKVKELCVIIWKTKATRKSVMQLFWLKQNQHVNFFSRKVDIDFRERNKKVIKTLFYLSHNRKKRHLNRLKEDIFWGVP